MAQSRRMNNDLSLLMVQWNSAVAISTRKCIITQGYGGVKKRKQKTKNVSNIYWMDDGINARSNLWNIMRNKKW